MKKLISFVLTLIIISNPLAKADEGMWLLPLLKELNMETMQGMGLELSAEQIYSVNQSSLKDAIVIFGGGCTGEMISDKGLLLTNHHCGFDKIQELSSLENNYLDNGFWAASTKEELPAPGLSVTFIREIIDVSDSVLAKVTPGMSASKRAAAVREAIDKLSKNVGNESNESAEIKQFFAGNQYFMIISQVYNDVRFVGAPPSSIGKFGYDTDNWVWPRHTGDFSLFRVYSDMDGNPADYSPDNVPYQPLHHFPVSIKGYEKGDFAMTLGFPGSTERYLPSWGIEERMNIFNRALITVRGEKQDIWADDMAASDKTRLQYASKFTRSSNYWKNSIGMNRGLEALDVISQKRELEAEFAQWANSSDSLKSIYGNLLASLEEGYQSRADNYLALNYMRETMLRGTEILSFALNARPLEKALKEKNQKNIDLELEMLKKTASEFFKDYNPNTDQKVMAAMLKRYQLDIKPKFYPSFYKDITKKYKGDFQLFAEKLFLNSVFADEAKLNNFLNKPSLKKLLADPAYSAAISAMDKNLSLISNNSEAQANINEANRLFMAGLMEMNPDKVFYPDANFSLRLSYGTVGDYHPRDGVKYKHYTTLKGVMEKEDPSNFEFIVPEKLKELYRNSDYGRYAAEDGRMYLNFTTDNDITGGNSGSPVINAQGQLIGLAFDGNWEAMSGDIAFEPDLQKCINVDIRYILFIIDKYADADYLIDEMTLIQ